MSNGGGGGAVASLRAAVDELLDVDLTRLGGEEVAEMLQAVEVERRRLAAVDQRLLGEVVKASRASTAQAHRPRC